jgi:hypothetical protein
MGSSREARIAGIMPKKMPTLAEKPNADGKRPPWQGDGEAGQPVDQERDGRPDDDAEDAAQGSQEHGLEQETARGSPTRRAPMDFPDANLARTARSR